MSRQFTLNNDWYGEDDFNIFKKKKITIKSGLTVLVGCNGAGKTTLLKQIEQSLKSKDIPVMLHNNKSDGERELKSRAALYGDFNIVAKLMMSSEGENIVSVMSEIARKMGDFTRRNGNSKELWFMFDAVDSGLSIDNILEIKEQLIPIVLEHNADKDIYFLISTNSYEFARGENCFDVINGKYIKFANYEEYRDFILKSKEQKLERYDA